jgi:hypothetical protein
MHNTKGIRERNRERKARELERKKWDEIDLAHYLSFEDAFAFLEISRRSFATMLACYREYWELHDMVEGDRHAETRRFGEMALEDEGRSIDEMFGKGARDFPKPVRVMRRYYFDRSRLTRFRALQRGECPLP